jgi:hypothetical protein
MSAKGSKNNENRKINEEYIPSDYKHVQAVLQKATERTLEELLGSDWKAVLNDPKIRLGSEELVDNAKQII